MSQIVQAVTKQPVSSMLCGKPIGGATVDQTIKGLYQQHVYIEFETVTIDSDVLDCEFTVPFDNNTEANETEIILYNLSYNTTNQIRESGAVTIKAGYGDDIGVIFSGTVSKKEIRNEDSDRILTLAATDSAGRTGWEVDVSYCEGNTAQGILYDLCARLNFPIVSFAPIRDYVFEREVHVEGSLMDAIEKYAGICGVSAYVCKGCVYIQPLSYSNAETYSLSAETGLLSTDEYEKEEKNGEFEDTIRGWKLKALLNHRVQTGTRVELNSPNASGVYFVQEGEHSYDGDSMITELLVVER